MKSEEIADLEKRLALAKQYNCNIRLITEEIARLQSCKSLTIEYMAEKGQITINTYENLNLKEIYLEVIIDRLKDLQRCLLEKLEEL